MAALRLASRVPHSRGGRPRASFDALEFTHPPGTCALHRDLEHLRKVCASAARTPPHSACAPCYEGRWVGAPPPGNPTLECTLEPTRVAYTWSLSYHCARTQFSRPADAHLGLVSCFAAAILLDEKIPPPTDNHAVLPPLGSCIAPTCTYAACAPRRRAEVRRDAWTGRGSARSASSASGTFDEKIVRLACERGDEPAQLYNLALAVDQLTTVHPYPPQRAGVVAGTRGHNSAHCEDSRLSRPARPEAHMERRRETEWKPNVFGKQSWGDYFSTKILFFNNTAQDAVRSTCNTVYLRLRFTTHNFVGDEQRANDSSERRCNFTFEPNIEIRPALTTGRSALSPLRHPPRARAPQILLQTLPYDLAARSSVLGSPSMSRPINKCGVFPTC